MERTVRGGLEAAERRRRRGGNVGSGRGKSGKGRKRRRREEWRREGRGESELLSAATALLICYLLLHLPHLAFSSLFIRLFIIAAARNLDNGTDLIDLQKQGHLIGCVAR